MRGERFLDSCALAPCLEVTEVPGDGEPRKYPILLFMEGPIIDYRPCVGVEWNTYYPPVLCWRMSSSGSGGRFTSPQVKATVSEILKPHLHMNKKDRHTRAPRPSVN